MILVAAAGGGREAIALAKKGFSITAFDSNETLVSACRANASRAGVEAIVLNSKPDGIPGNLGTYDGLFVGRGAYHHIPGRSSRICFLQKCKEHLAPKARVFLGDFHTFPANSIGIKLSADVARVVRRLRRSSDPIELGDRLNAENYYHRFRREEIESELHESGFQLDLYSESPWSEDSDLAFAIASANS